MIQSVVLFFFFWGICETCRIRIWKTHGIYSNITQRNAFHRIAPVANNGLYLIRKVSCPTLAHGYIYQRLWNEILQRAVVHITRIIISWTHYLAFHRTMFCTAWYWLACLYNCVNELIKLQKQLPLAIHVTHFYKPLFTAKPSRVWIVSWCATLLWLISDRNILHPLEQFKQWRHVLM